MGTDEKVLTMILEGRKSQQAPIKQTRTPDHRSYFFAIGNDYYAELIISEDAIESLKEINFQQNKLDRKES